MWYEDTVVLRFAAGMGLAAVWMTPLVAAGRRRGGPLFRPAGWRTLVASGLCGLLAAACAIARALFLWGFSGRLFDAAEQAAALCIAAAQGLSLLALIFAWRAWDADPSLDGTQPDQANDEPNALDAPFLPPGEP
ncbi:hypothetical protein [Alienimonas chondri]|uniref:DUF4345 domain-containing protein n=1 Tax=Alienimonas chondri TaxID=2681879 RepID=A0ABX1VDB7_9PLAN|nr:hypothetical protein [Alienimonas chondri]NNJ25788.1 hypothetical protein [Alienimonas chondri]